MNFYEQFIPAFAQIVLPIMNLFKTKGGSNHQTNQLLKWTMECQAAFEKLKWLFAVSKPVSKHPDPEKPFII